MAQNGEVVAQNGGEMRKDGVEVVEGRCEGGEVLIWGLFSKIQYLFGRDGYFL